MSTQFTVPIPQYNPDGSINYDATIIHAVEDVPPAPVWDKSISKFVSTINGLQFAVNNDQGVITNAQTRITENLALKAVLETQLADILASIPPQNQ